MVARSTTQIFQRQSFMYMFVYVCDSFTLKQLYQGSYAHKLLFISVVGGQELELRTIKSGQMRI